MMLTPKHSATECNRSKFIVAVQFNSHKSVQKLFRNWHITFSNSLMGLKLFVNLRKNL